ncbi:hypothetical protein LNTAR_16473 [Lentisphaera araneosa HTCC2155]|uniref:Uncharacterized protein n=1 Tax=Lentisphaera araneosa HTCC2155 TaxID=313628 RepID=A6DQA9_9BACT|nr:hypothetical protein LNTAR_16473 [Lentisphaera araneosa HTCC2155]
MMFNHITKIAVLITALFNYVLLADGSNAIVTPESVWQITKKVADWQINTFERMGEYRGLPAKRHSWNHTKKYHDLEWHCGALYVGMYEWSTISKDSKYTDWLMNIGNRNGWSLYRRLEHADDHTVGQFYLKLYEQFGQSAMLEPTQKQFDQILEKHSSLKKPKKHWYWSDVLFMAPPVWARLAKVTGDKRYLDFMDVEYHKSYDMLWDVKSQLFWRDKSYIKKRETNGEKIFWARGNGWVFGGLALMIPDLP